MMNAMEIDSQYETAKNACVTTMRSQQLCSPAPPPEELRQTGRNMAVALVSAAPANPSLRDIDDITLDHEIAQQEGLVASNPSMAKYMLLSLQMHQAERQRRNVALGPALLAVDQLASAPTGAAEAAQAAGGMQVAITQPAAEAVTEAAPAGPRLRTRVVRFGEDVNAATAEPKAVTEMREHLKFMRNAIKENAKRLRCPLLGVQMQQVALASDGHFYDLRAIQTHIRANLGRPMVSPITKRSMLVSVHHMQKGKKTLWTPELCGNPPPAVCDTRVAVVPPSPSA